MDLEYMQLQKMTRILLSVLLINIHLFSFSVHRAAAMPETPSIEMRTALIRLGCRETSLIASSLVWLGA